MLPSVSQFLRSQFGMEQPADQPLGDGAPAMQDSWTYDETPSVPQTFTPPPEPAPTYEIVDGRTTPPTPNGQWESWQVTPNPQVPQPVPDNQWLAEDSVSTPVQVAEPITPPPSPYDPVQEASMRPREDRFEERPGYGQVVASPGEPDYVRPRQWYEPTSTERRAVSEGVEAMRTGRQADGSRVGESVLPEWAADAATRGLGAASALNTVSEGVFSRVDPVFQAGLAVDGIVETEYDEQTRARVRQLQAQASHGAMQQADQDELDRLTAPARARYEQIKDNPDAVTRMANASPSKTAVSLTLGVLGIAAGSGAGSAASGAATRLGAGAQTARRVGYAADVLAQSATDPTNVLTQPAIDAALPAVRGAVNAARGARGLVDDATEAAGRVWREGRALADDLNAQPGGVTAAGLGAVPESRRFYHGTAGSFERPDPGRFDPNGLFGPGYYLTSDPRVASSYADAGMSAASDAGKRQARLLADREELVPYIESYRSGPLREAFGPERADRELADVQRQIANIDRQLAEIPSGPNVRAVDVPSGLRLLDVDAPVASDVIDRVVTALPEDAAQRFRRSMRLIEWDKQARKMPPMEGAGFRNELRSVLGDDAETNRALAAAGFDGITHKGGQRVPLLDDAGNPIEHDVTIIFPESLNKIRNAFSGEVGGISVGGTPIPVPGTGILPTVNRALSEGIAGGVGGAVIEQARNPDEDPRTAAARGFAVGAVGFPAATRLARAAAGRAGTRVTAASMGSLPERPAMRTVEVLQDKIADTRRVLQDIDPNVEPELHRQVQDRMARLTSELVDAQNARTRLEPAISSDVGRRANPLTMTEEGADTLTDAMRAQERVSPEDAANLGGPASVPTPYTSTRLNASFGILPPSVTPNPQRVEAAAKAGPRQGAKLNAPLKATDSSAMPRSVRLSQALTDDRAAMRWGEDVLTDAAGRERLPESSAQRPSTQTRVNPDSVAEARIEDDLAATVADAEREGLLDEVTQHLEDMHAFDVLVNTYRRAADEARAVAEGAVGKADERATAIREAGEARIEKLREQLTERIQAMRDRNARPETIARAEQGAATRIQREQDALAARLERTAVARDADAEAQAAGDRAMRQWARQQRNTTPEAIVERLEGQRQRLAQNGQQDRVTELAQRVWFHNQQTFQSLVEAGRLSADDAKRLADEYPHYVPSQPISDLLPDGSGGMAASAPGAGTVGSGTQKALEEFDAAGSGPGRSGALLNPIIASRNATIVRERLAQRNRVFTRFWEMVQAAQTEGADVVDASVGRRPNRLAGEVEVSGWVDGERQTIRVPKPVADMLDAAAQSGNPDAAISFWGAVKRAVTETITSRRPAFFAVNLLRDFGDYAFKASAELGGPKALPRTARAYADELGRAFVDVAAAIAPKQALVGGAASGAAGAAMGPEDQTWQERLVRGGLYAAAGAGAVGLAGRRIVPTGRAAEYMARGGGMGTANPGWRAGEQWLREAQRSGGLVARNPKELAQHVGDILKDLALFEPMAQIGNRAELIPRAARMRLAEQAGENATEAMVRGRDATVDFARGGEIAKSWNRLIPFFNVTMQGGAQLARTFRDHRAAATTTAAATLGPLMLVTELYNRETPERAEAYSDVPSYVKDSGIVMMMPWAGSDARGERPNYLWIPTGMVTPFVMAAREAMANVPGLEPVQGEGLSETAISLLTMFSPVKGENLSSLAATVVPPIAKQGIELGTNKSTFTGGTIATDSADERASAFGQAVAGGVNRVGQMVGSDSLQEVRPSQVDYLTRQLPAYGDLIQGVSNDMAPSSRRQDESRSIQNLPVLGQSAGRIVRDTGGANLERAQEAMLTDGIREVLQDAGMRPSDVAAVPSRYKGAPLTRDEQLRWQEVTNTLLERKITQATRTGEWRARGANREQIVRDAIAEARDEAAARVLRRLTDQEIERRKRRAS